MNPDIEKTFCSGMPAPTMPAGALQPRRPQASEPEPFGLFDTNWAQRDEVAQAPLPLTSTEAKP